MKRSEHLFSQKIKENWKKRYFILRNGQLAIYRSIQVNYYLISFFLLF